MSSWQPWVGNYLEWYNQRRKNMSDRAPHETRREMNEIKQKILELRRVLPELHWAENQAYIGWRKIQDQSPERQAYDAALRRRHAAEKSFYELSAKFKILAFEIEGLGDPEEPFTPILTQGTVKIT